MSSLGAALVHTAARDLQADLSSIAIGPFVYAMRPQVAALLHGNIRLVVSIDEEAGHVVCNPGRLESAIRNLVLNARDAMPDGGVLSFRGYIADFGKFPELHVGTIRPGLFAAITVAGSGCGMSEDVLCRCFEPFMTTKKMSGGTGLGLFQLRAFAEEIGGFVQMQSQVDQRTEGQSCSHVTSHLNYDLPLQAKEQWMRHGISPTPAVYDAAGGRV